jgi:hypothetical protein
MERAGVLRTVAMRISGHRSEAVYRRYAIVSTEDAAEAMARTEAYVTEQSADKTRTIQRSGPESSVQVANFFTNTPLLSHM